MKYSIFVQNFIDQIQMIVYNTTFHIEKDSINECLAYLKKQYIPKAAASGFVQKPCLRRIIQTEQEEGESFSVQFHVKNMDTLNFWLQNEGNLLQKDLVNRFGYKIAGFSTLLEELDWKI